jgi:hypothetical protein
MIAAEVVTTTILKVLEGRHRQLTDLGANLRVPAR